MIKKRKEAKVRNVEENYKRKPTTEEEKNKKKEEEDT